MTVKCGVCGLKSPELYGVGCQSIDKHTVCSKCVTRIIKQYMGD